MQRGRDPERQAGAGPLIGGRLKVSLFSQYFSPSLGFGISRYSYELLAGLRRKKIEVDAVSSFESFHSPLKSGLDYFLYLPARAALARRDSDICHFAMHQIGFCIPAFKMFHSKKTVATVHDISPILFLRSRLLRKALDHSVLGPEAVIADSELTKQGILEHYHVPEEKIHVVHIGADESFRPMEVRRKVFTIGYVGGFSQHKQVPFLIRAYSRFEKSSSVPSMLVLYGKGPEYEKCRKLAAILGINAEFRGFAKEKDLPAIYNSFDAFAFPSLFEGFGLPIIEAQRCRVPVVVRSDALIPEEVTRYCLKARGEEGMSELFHRLSRKKPPVSEEQEEHTRRFSWENCVDGTISVYESLL